MAKSDKLSPLCNELYSRVRSSHYLTFAHSTTVHAIHSNVNKKNLKGTSRHSFENHSKKRGEKEGITHLSKVI